MLTNKDYCDYDTCVALKELGFPIDWFEEDDQKMVDKFQKYMEE